MSHFETKVYKAIIESHPNADAIEICRIGDFTSIVKKGEYKTGDLVVYIMEGSVLPEWVLKKLDFWNYETNKGKLARTNGDGVKTMRLRGVLSEGIIYPLEHPKWLNEDQLDAILLFTDQVVATDERILQTENGPYTVHEGDDVTTLLGITKWSPPIPIHMAGEVYNGDGKTIRYDIENIKKYNRVMEEGEDVVFTEKLHGTWCCLGTNKASPYDGKIVSSKGLSSDGLAFKLNENNSYNVYIRILESTKDNEGYDLLDHVKMKYDHPVYVLGECFGPIQDLTYGYSTPQFRIFDVYFGEPGKGRYLNFDEMVDFCFDFNLQLVPVLYRGPYSKELMLKYTDGKETISGEGIHIREGIVIKPTIERSCEWLSRVILKSVSKDYILRKAKSGQELSEFQ